MIGKYLDAKKLYNLLINENIKESKGHITFKLASTETVIKCRDIIGNSLQSWLGTWLEEHNIFYFTSDNTQEFPDFYLDFDNAKDNMLELKTFNYNATPAFDIANFESYVDSLRTNAYRLNADYLIMGYTLDEEDGTIVIKDLWLKKIWEISGPSNRFALTTQVKRGMIYNIRPKNFTKNSDHCFSNKEEFIKAIYDTLKEYKDLEFANKWLNDFKYSYKEYYNKEIDINI